MKYAVVVGSDEYINYTELQYAESDATRVRDTLVDMRPGNFTRESAALLVDAAPAPQKPTRANILVAVRRMCKKAKKGDLILFYFAGHGFSDDRASYLVARDTHPEALEETAIRVEELLGIMKKANATSKILLLDACRNTPESEKSPRGAGEPVQSRGTFSLDFARMIDVQAQQTGWELASACGPGQFAWESAVTEGGVWTNCLLASIAEKAPTEAVNVFDLVESARERMDARKTEAGAAVQDPYYQCDRSNSAILLDTAPIDESPTSDVLVLTSSVEDLTSAVSRLTTVMEQQGVVVLVRGNPHRFKKCAPADVAPSKASIHLVPFYSEAERSDLSQEAQDANQEFFLRVYTPPQEQYRYPYKRLFILFNGLAEADPSTLDEIGWQLAELKGVPVVLMPLPSHFVRHYEFVKRADAETDPYRVRGTDTRRLLTQRVLQALLHNPSRMLHAYRQILSDTHTLLREIKRQSHPYWSLLLASDTEVSLLGYSIGGFAALSLLLLEPDRYRSVFLLESGAFFDQIHAGALFHRNEAVARSLWRAYARSGNSDPKMTLAEDESFFWLRTSEGHESECKAYDDFKKALTEGDDELQKEHSGEPWRIFLRPHNQGEKIWQDLVIELYTAVERAGQLLIPNEAEVFRRVFLGFESLVYRKQLTSLSRKILLITGGADDVFPTEVLLRVGPETGLAILQIPELSHWIRYGSRDKWAQWNELLIEWIDTFDRSHPQKKMKHPG